MNILGRSGILAVFLPEISGGQNFLRIDSPTVLHLHQWNLLSRARACSLRYGLAKGGLPVEFHNGIKEDRLKSGVWGRHLGPEMTGRSFAPLLVYHAGSMTPNPACPEQETV